MRLTTGAAGAMNISGEVVSRDRRSRLNAAPEAGDLIMWRRAGHQSPRGG